MRISSGRGFTVGSSLLFVALTAAHLAAQQPQTESEYSIRIGVNLTQFDVVVTDAHGNRVTGLRPDDFEVREDGVTKPITHFTEIPAAAEDAASSPKPEQPTISGVHRTFLFLLDDEEISPADFFRAKLALTRALGQLRAGDVATVIGASGNSGFGGEFSSDPGEVRAAANALRWVPEPQIPQLRRYRYIHFEATLHRAIYYLNAFPGRKFLFLISARPVDWCAPQLLDRVSDDATRAGVVVYGVDSRGLQTFLGNAASELPKRPPPGIVLSQAGPRLLAEKTGGLYYNDNDEASALRHQLDDAAGSYYMIGWGPGADAFRRKDHRSVYRRVEIRVRPQSVPTTNLRVRTRKGFFGYSGQLPAPAAFTVAQQMHRALFSPLAYDGLRVQLTASSAPGAITAQLRVRPENVRFTTGPDGCRSADFEVLFLFRPLASAAADLDSHAEGDIVRARACGPEIADMERNGFVATIRRRVGPGPYEVHAAIRQADPNDEQPSINALLIRTSGLKRRVVESTSIGAAAQFIEIPDPAARLKLSTITLGDSALANVPEAISFRTVQSSDPAVRMFHPGDAVPYTFGVYGEDAAGAQYRVTILREGEPFEQGELRPGAREVQGSYRLPQSAAPGNYMLGIIAESGGKRTARAMEWIDFRVAP